MTDAFSDAQRAFGESLRRATEEIHGYVEKLLRSEHDRLEADLWEAVRLSDYDGLERLHVVALARWARDGDVSLADQVGWAASYLVLP